MIQVRLHRACKWWQSANAKPMTVTLQRVKNLLKKIRRKNRFVWWTTIFEATARIKFAAKPSKQKLKFEEKCLVSQNGIQSLRKQIFPILEYINCFLLRIIQKDTGSDHLDNMIRAHLQSTILCKTASSIASMLRNSLAFSRVRSFSMISWSSPSPCLTK